MTKGSETNMNTSPTTAAPAQTVGGARTNHLHRRNVGSSQKAAPASGRRAAGNSILKFYTDDAPGIKVGPTTVLVLSLAYMGCVVCLHILAKFRSVVASSTGGADEATE
ncbi:Protein transport protein Sec61 subunit beta, putative [Perkinsus marinus ATCC 50983]|uniref:Protein transport protein Sec61 subunit beta n=1 Tax=Perkinsus marinus (strain ATCC 50983 / TXsc) TaxID=423536 RepID=C5KCJ5_PERM5|nr:Protein transport protein Sec61 subunit beta, putative [Perkinsus marinus ATCC 50983]XP_002785798.1 Protein transport protein Sec61 subunit beta, putative [Perkinsus marinus ATCC 50983]EER04641.1 Protein transport protein Sec61 subunit beta, putative [Perkinsus marinus ATCC 50983]EER17594.1 Protein transport protein Sec61 subunit beta, putative [Perkinsus marinus ATCC 50983]|eukprot:XP_002772825.1 Protein transport protein Sec61 subunit beta, putative [Perkinsus marinus ATCC 50983]